MLYFLAIGKDKYRKYGGISSLYKKLIRTISWPLASGLLHLASGFTLGFASVTYTQAYSRITLSAASINGSQSLQDIDSLGRVSKRQTVPR